MNPALGIKKEIREIRLHGVFATLAEKPNDWIYFNLALLNVEGDLPKIAPLASPDELGKLKEETLSVASALRTKARRRRRPRQFEPQLFPGSIFMMTVARHLPGQPRLLHIDAKIPPNVYGSPIFNENGEVVGCLRCRGAPCRPRCLAH